DRFGEAALRLRDPRAHAVSGEPAADEDDEAVQPGDAVPAICERVDAELDLLTVANRCGHRASVTSGHVTSGDAEVARQAECDDPAEHDRSAGPGSETRIGASFERG